MFGAQNLPIQSFSQLGNDLHTLNVILKQARCVSINDTVEWQKSSVGKISSQYLEYRHHQPLPPLLELLVL